MTSLQNLQAQFQTALLLDQAPLPGLLNQSGDAQFAVYLHAYRARLRFALRDNYEAVAKIMGDDAFDALANAYIDAHPSSHYSVRWFGHQLSHFMAANEALISHPAMIDLAVMEWALRSAFDAPQAGRLEHAELAALVMDDWPQLRFELHPAVQLLHLQWAVGPVWHALKAGQLEVDAPGALAHPMLIWRDGLHTQWKSLSTAEHVFVEGVFAGHTFAQLCEALANEVGEDDAAQTAVKVLRELMLTGVISSLHMAAPVSEPCKSCGSGATM